MHWASDVSYRVSISSRGSGIALLQEVWAALPSLANRRRGVCHKIQCLGSLVEWEVHRNVWGYQFCQKGRQEDAILTTRLATVLLATPSGRMKFDDLGPPPPPRRAAGGHRGLDCRIAISTSVFLRCGVSRKSLEAKSSK